MGELLPVRSVQGRVQRGRLPRMGAADALDTRQVRGQAPSRDERTPPPLLRSGVAVRPQRGRVHRRLQRHGETLPLPRQHHPDPVDPGTGSHLAADQRARHVESPVRGDAHAGCGGRARETHREQSRQGAPVRPNRALLPVPVALLPPAAQRPPGPVGLPEIRQAAAQPRAPRDGTAGRSRTKVSPAVRALASRRTS
jgi:hypothetical protein